MAFLPVIVQDGIFIRTNGPQVVQGPGALPECFAPFSADTKYFQFAKKDPPYPTFDYRMIDNSVVDPINGGYRYCSTCHDGTPRYGARSSSLGRYPTTTSLTNEAPSLPDRRLPMRIRTCWPASSS